MTIVHTLASGSSGNCVLVSDGKTHILVDAGISMRRISKSLGQLGIDVKDLSAVLITHEHHDHICGLETMGKNFGFPVYAARETAGRILRSAPSVSGCLREFEAGESFEVDGVGVCSFITPHDTPVSVGYKLCTSSGKVGVVTDLGYVPPGVLDAVADADMLVLEANHDVYTLETGRYPYFLKKRILGSRGHLSNDACAEMACEMVKRGLKKLLLAHLSIENNTPRMAYETVCDGLCGIGARPGEDVVLGVAPRDTISPRFVLG